MNVPSLSNRRIAWIALTISAIGLARPILATEEKFDSSGITILDAQGRITPNAPAAPNSHTVDVTVGPGLSFNPDFVTIVAGDTIRWTWASGNHTVTSGSSFCVIDQAYCSPSNAANCSTAPTSTLGSTYSHTFVTPGTYSYLCRIHCGSGMTGSLTVVAAFVSTTTVSHPSNGHFIFSGKTIANATITIEASPDLFTIFTGIGTATADASGVFQFDDGSDPTRVMRFYRAVYQ